MSGRTADTAVGMMDAAYFIGRKELLDFYNDLLSLNLAKIEQTASGAIACQITEMIFPGSIALSKIDWSAKTDYEYIQNYKLLQAAFTKHHVQRHVDVDKLIRAKYQDNLEFCQWLKAFYDQSGSIREGYDPIAARNKGKGGKQYNMTMGRTGKIGGAKPVGLTRGTSAKQAALANTNRNTTTTTTKTSSPARRRAEGSVATARPTTKSLSTSSPSKRADTTRPLRERNSPVEAKGKQAINASSQSQSISSSSASSAVADAMLIKKNADLLIKNDELEQAIMEIEKERDFYFEKLRNVEVMLQIYQEKLEAVRHPDILIDNIFKVLYATSDDNVIVTEDGEAIPQNQSTLSPGQQHQGEEEIETPQPDDDDDDDLLFREADHHNQHNHNTPMLLPQHHSEQEMLFADCEQD